MRHTAYTLQSKPRASSRCECLFLKRGLRDARSGLALVLQCLRVHCLDYEEGFHTEHAMAYRSCAHWWRGSSVAALLVFIGGYSFGKSQNRQADNELRMVKRSACRYTDTTLQGFEATAGDS